MDQFLKSYDTFQEEQPCYQGFFVAAFTQDKFMVKDVKSLNNFDDTQEVWTGFFFQGQQKFYHHHHVSGIYINTFLYNLITLKENSRYFENHYLILSYSVFEIMIKPS